MTRIIFGSRNKRQSIIDELLKQPTDVLALALVYAYNYKTYGVDVTQAWDTATQNCVALERSYIKGVKDTKEELYKIYE